MVAMRTLLIGAGAMGAAAAGVTGVVLYDGADHHLVERETMPAAAGSADPICLRSPLPYFDDVEARCYSKDELVALYDRPVMNRIGEQVEVTMVHPADMTTPEANCSVCRTYLDYANEGWFAMTARDQRREAYFRRACGALQMLEQADRPSTVFFNGGVLQASDITALVSVSELQFGEINLEGATANIERTGTGQWRVADGDLVMTIDEIATADFDSDTIGEILAFIQIGPSDGTAEINVLGLINKDSAEEPVTFVSRNG